MPDIVVERVAGTFLFSGESDRGREWLAGRSLSASMLRSGRFLEALALQTAKDLADLATAAQRCIMRFHFYTLGEARLAQPNRRLCSLRAALDRLSGAVNDVPSPKMTSAGMGSDMDGFDATQDC
ncbi:MAG: hypothetical protein K1X67_15110 [Fimbriimonadaceae bacterium]|nr:hypothetical protein [Fimbriimonadaceae bacterium]